MQDEFDVIDQWKRTGMLTGLSEQTMDHAAYLFENQRIYNVGDDSLTPQFRRISIPLLRRLIGSLTERNMKVETYLTDVFPRFLETNIDAEIKLPEGLAGTEIMDYEKEGVAKMSEQLADLLTNFAKAKKAKNFYLEGLGLENGKLVVFYEL